MTTMQGVPDLSPDPDDVLQVEAPEPVVQVRPVGPVRVQDLPRVSAGIRGLTVPDGPPKQLLTADPHRATATIITSDLAILIGGSAQDIQGGQPGQLPAGTVLKFGATDELWATALGGTVTTVTVIQERWANG
ncbi:hypothetical protein JGS39_24090 [Streptomyces sp. P01-B04]|uniref:hypothetical protein n=1 Tax=Streptomyces poriferorum TaxID=2798799 RepID=UPI001C5F6CFE|nr:hypothetical protein [Streptomyces poriferorum]MBW5252043.1 hypothetical protein [Streptomyces poriferorum]MBW5260213.1 hypothetical protein [Streptomyces poriferorum]